MTASVSLSKGYALDKEASLLLQILDKSVVSSMHPGRHFGLHGPEPFTCQTELSLRFFPSAHPGICLLEGVLLQA